MPDEVKFTEKEQIVGYVELHSGSIILVDGIVEPDINLSQRSYVSLDLGLDRKRVPIVATQQGGRRYLLIPLEAATPIENPAGETVQTEDQVEMPKKEDEETNEPG
jgi:hypothetical protein